ncbi:MAG: hypothetical protein KBS59_05795 [Clostridiales bacterium]|nr:hypothetical protein [Clostridiales bacterium]
MDENNEINESTEIVPETAQSTETKTEKTSKFIEMFKSPLFLAICILLTVSAAFSLWNGSFDILLVLMTVGVWLSYGKSKKGQSPFPGMNIASGVLKAEYIITWVACVMLFVAGLIFVIATAAVDVAFGDIFAEIESELSVFGIGSEIEMLKEELDEILAIVGLSYAAIVDILLIIIAIGMVFGAMIAVLLNVFCVNKLHIFAKSLCDNEKDGFSEIKKISAAKNWCLALGIIVGISALVSGFDISLASLAAALCCSYAWIKGNFAE